MKLKKNKILGGEGSGERRKDAFLKIIFCVCVCGGGGGGGGGRRVGDQDGCDRRREIFVKIQKNCFFWGGGSGRLGRGVRSGEGVGVARFRVGG